uniref:Uncharacterized protein n=1 Tax=Anguilla anguilla TaxID=7936 RepID=A0A0E9V4N2_ANGAN
MVYHFPSSESNALHSQTETTVFTRKNE